MSQSTDPPPAVKNNIVRARVTIRGTRPLLQHWFGPDAIPLEARERTGVAGNDPTEWQRSCMVTPDGQLHLYDANVFACLRDGAKFIRKGRGSIQPMVCATLQVEESIILLNRRMPENGDPPLMNTTAPVYIHRCSVKNPSTKGRNIRYRLACSPGWECSFTITWDKTIIGRDLMRAALERAASLAGICDGRYTGFGRFEVVAYEELSGAEEASAAGGVEANSPDHLGTRQKKVRKVRQAAEADGVPH